VIKLSTGKPDAGEPPVRFGGEGNLTNSSYPYEVAIRRMEIDLFQGSASNLVPLLPCCSLQRNPKQKKLRYCQKMSYVNKKSSTGQQWLTKNYFYRSSV
jgi:hypothetical protein